MLMVHLTRSGSPVRFRYSAIAGLAQMVEQEPIANLKAKASRRKVERFNMSKGESGKVVRMLGESPNVWKQVEFFRSRRNFSSFPLGQQPSIYPPFGPVSSCPLTP